MFLQSFLFIFLDYADNFQVFLELGIFEEGLVTYDFVKKISNFLLGFVPFVLLVLALCGNFNLHLGRFSRDHALSTC